MALWDQVSAAVGQSRSRTLSGSYLEQQFPGILGSSTQQALARSFDSRLLALGLQAAQLKGITGKCYCAVLHILFACSFVLLAVFDQYCEQIVERVLEKNWKMIQFVQYLNV